MQLVSRYHCATICLAALVVALPTASPSRAAVLLTLSGTITSAYHDPDGYPFEPGQGFEVRLTLPSVPGPGTGGNYDLNRAAAQVTTSGGYRSNLVLSGPYTVRYGGPAVLSFGLLGGADDQFRLNLTLGGPGAPTLAPGTLPTPEQYALFTEGSVFFDFQPADGSDRRAYFQGSVSSVSAVAVPEPATLAAGLLGAGALTLASRRGRAYPPRRPL